MTSQLSVKEADLKILFITRRFPPSTGGMEKFAFDLYTALKNSSEVSIISWGGSNIWLPIVLPIFFIRAVYKLTAGKFDIIHMQDGVLSVMGVVLGKIFRKPVCTVVHGLDVTYDNRLYQAIIPAALRKTDHVFCISSAVYDEVLKRNVLAAKSNIIPLGITDDLFTNNKPAARSFVDNQLKLNKDTNILLSVGRLVERKGVKWFVDNVMPELKEIYGSKVVFVVSGEGEQRSEIEAAIEKHNLKQQVLLLGRADDHLLQQLYNSADIFVMPNIPIKGDMEGFGRVLLEASLCELPIVASGIEGIKDAIKNNQNGLLVKAGLASDHLASIKKFLDNQKFANQFGQKSRRFTLENYNWSAVSTRYINEYQKLKSNN